MRIECAKCGHTHDSTSTPFKHDVVPSKQVSSNWKRSNSKFVCGKCGLVNKISIIWYTIGK